MGIPQGKIEQIRSAANIVEIIGEYIPLKRVGKNYVGLCPFHHETSPSFTVSGEKQIFHCFGCGIGGNVFHFLMKYRQYSFREAIEEVANRYGLPLPTIKTTPEEEKIYRLKKDILRVNQQVARFYHQYLTQEKDGKKAREYLKARDIREDTISSYMLGYAPPRWDSLAQFFRRENISTALAIQSGLLIEKEGGGVYDRFRDRIIFPIFNSKGKVIAFGGRVLDDSLPKYINSPETPVYQKGFCLYGANVARQWAQQEGKVILVEGYFDLLSLHARGIKYVVATLGTALTSAQVRILKGLSTRVILIYDADVAGKKASKGCIPHYLSEFSPLENLFKEEVSVDILPLPEGYDPDSFMSKVGKEGFLKFLTQARPLVDWYLESGEKETRADFEKRWGFVQEAANVISQFKNPLKKRDYMDRLCQLFHVEPALIQNLPRETSKSVRSLDLTASFPSFELRVMEFLFCCPQFIPSFKQYDVSEVITHPLLNQLLNLMFEIYERQNKLDFGDLLLNIKEEVIKSLVAHWAMEPSPFKEDMAKDFLGKIEEKRLEKQLKSLLTQIKEDEKRGNVRTELLKEYDHLSKKKKRLIKEAEIVKGGSVYE